MEALDNCEYIYPTKCIVGSLSINVKTSQKKQREKITKHMFNIQQKYSILKGLVLLGAAHCF